jgi:uncharacterized protein YbjT (DUF2867 family)
MILITGAGGKTGRALVKAIAKTQSVCAFVHRRDQESVLKSFGAEKVIVGDMRDEAAIRAALQGVKAVYHICPNMSADELMIGKSVIGEAVKARVEHFVYHSVLHPQTEKMNHHWQKLRVEEILFETGLPFTILQPAPYMQNLVSGWKRVVEDGVLRVPYSVHSKFSFVDLEDIAAVATTVLSEAKYRNGIFELAGTPPMSLVEAAQIFGRALNRQVRAETEGIDEWRLRAEQIDGLSEYAVENLSKMFDYYNQWGLAGNPTVLQWILGRAPTTLAAFAERTALEL